MIHFSRSWGKHFCFCCFFCFSLLADTFGQHLHQDQSKTIDWSDTRTINPLRKEIGDFLDTDLSVYRNKALDAYRSGDYKEAARNYLMLLRHDIHDATSIYNLACCYGLLGMEELAAKYLKRAVNAGFEDIDHIRQDPDFDKVRGEKIFDETVNKLASGIAQKREKQGDFLYVAATAFFRCRIHLPDNYDPQKSYPLVVGLHGFGDNPEDFSMFWGSFNKAEFIYVTPQAPYPILGGRKIGYSWNVVITGAEELLTKATAITEDYIKSVIDILSRRFNIDGVYLLGFSQGAVFAYNVGIKYYPLLKGIICFGGRFHPDELTEESIQTANGLRVFIGHSKDDRAVTYAEAVQARDILTENGYNVTFYDFHGGHWIPEKALKEVQDWLYKE